MMFRTISILICSALISACSSLPDSLSTTNENVLTDYQQWVDAPVDQENEVRLGGIIANVTNLENQTRIEVVNMPINSVGKPSLHSEPTGRYVGYYNGYLESMSFAKGRLVTLLGVSDGEEQGKVDDFDMTFKVMNIKGFHLWRIEETVIVNDIESHFSPCYGLYCRGSRGLPSKGKVIQEVK
ncbi:Slp family lipoprotein [Vibrio sp. DW001]|uniref:Slp family lipoprotein n=1 Tax=unclassified Vibrio TaxID=2614977 RepID=UPI00189DD670|nr:MULTISPECIES: Slp family lipoprotein [unclassified Vibrio]UGA55607.1 Slp family lipoprotein [Vibrio sp. VB16]WED27480.1 Slp family lipoprotein [Vibrio sp. DW001]